MKTTITNNSTDRRAFRHANGLAVMDAGDERTLDGLILADKTRKRLEKDGWTFVTDAPAKAKTKAKAKAKAQAAEIIPEPAPDENA